MSPRRAEPEPAPRLAVVLKGWPRLSETFIAQELKALEERGHRFEIWSLRRPYDDKTHPIHKEVKARVRYLPEYLREAPLRVLRGVLRATFRAGFAPAFVAWTADFSRDLSLNRIRRFGQACVLASEAPRSMSFLYAHFLHTPGSVARYAAMIRAVEWGFSAHARDIWTIPEWEKREKLAHARFGFVCNEDGYGHLKRLAARPDRLEKIHHGLDLARFPPPEEPRPERRGESPEDAVRIVSVGRLVEKKGYDDLLRALADLGPDAHWRFLHLGGGPLLGALSAQAEKLGLTKRIEWRGPGVQADVLRLLREGDVFCLPAKVAADGDRDGLPNVLLEAASQELPILATHAGATQDFVIQQETGYLAPPGRPAVLKRALQKLIENPAERRRLGQAARRRLAEHFGADAGADRIDAHLKGALAARR